MGFYSLREWIEQLEDEGELKRVKTEVDWNLEIGGILRKVCDTEGPALLFENIKDHKNTLCTRLFTGSLATFSRVAMMMGLPKDTPYEDLIKVWQERSKKRVKPVMVDDGPCK